MLQYYFIVALAHLAAGWKDVGPLIVRHDCLAKSTKSGNRYVRRVIYDDRSGIGDTRSAQAKNEYTHQ